ncbi:ABC transporter permease [Oceanobacillus limi]
MTLFKKEMLENWRNKKWVWFPLVIILLSILDPISSYYMPQIIDSVGGLPDGTVLELPDYTPPEVVIMSLGQLSSLGVLVIVLMSMGTIAGERKSGVAELVLVKPVSYKNYVTAKWASLILLVWISLFLGLFVGWYYINILFGDLTFLHLLQITFFYGLWLTLVVTLVIFYNTWIKTPGLVAFLTIATIMIMSLITQVFGHFLDWSPNKLSNHIFESLMTDQASTDLIATGSVTIFISVLLLVASIYCFRIRSRV